VQQFYVLAGFTVGAFGLNSTQLVAFQLDPNTGAVIANQTLSYPLCSASTYPQPCSFAYVQPFIRQLNGQELVTVYQQRGESFYLLNNATLQLVSDGQYSSYCDSVYFIGWVGNYGILESSLSVACTCPSLTNACPLQLRVTVSPLSSPPPSRSSGTTHVLGWLLYSILMMFLLLEHVI